MGDLNQTVFFDDNPELDIVFIDDFESNDFLLSIIWCELLLVFDL